MENTEETEEQYTVKDQIVVAGGLMLATVCMGIIAHIGWDIYGEAKVSWKRHQAKKKEEAK